MTTKNTRKPRAAGRKSNRARKGNVAMKDSRPNSYNNNISVPTMPIFQNRVLKRLNYSESVALTHTLFGPGTYIYSTNGLYDPNITGTGHQPMGFDQMMVFYEHYVVTRMKAYVTFSNKAAFPVTVALSLNAANTSPSDSSALQEGGYIVKDRLTAAGTQGSVKTLSIFVNNKKFEVATNILDVDEFKGNVAANPVEQTYLDITSWDPDGKGGDLICEVYLEYDAWFVEPRKLTPSLLASLHKALLSEQKTSTSFRR